MSQRSRTSSGASVLVTHTSVDRFSTVADFELVVGENSYSPSQISRDFIILDPPTDIPPGEAELIIRMDAQEKRRQIQLPQGANRSTRRTPIIRELSRGTVEGSKDLRPSPSN